MTLGFKWLKTIHCHIIIITHACGVNLEWVSWRQSAHQPCYTPTCRGTPSVRNAWRPACSHRQLPSHVPGPPDSLTLLINTTHLVQLWFDAAHIGHFVHWSHWSLCNVMVVTEVQSESLRLVTEQRNNIGRAMCLQSYFCLLVGTECNGQPIFQHRVW